MRPSPGWCWDKYDDHSHYIEDANLADLLPVSATPTGDLADAEAIYDGANRNLVGIKSFANGAPQHGVMFGMSGAGKSVNMIDLLTQTEPYYDYTVIVEEGLSYGIYTQTVADEAEPIIIQPGGTLTFNYLDTGGLPLTSVQVANATALCQLMAGVCQDEDKNRLRGAQLSGSIRQLYRDFYDDWKRKQHDKHRELLRDTVALRPLATREAAARCHDVRRFRRLSRSQRRKWRAREWLASVTEEQIAECQHDSAASEETFRLAFAGLKPKRDAHAWSVAGASRDGCPRRGWPRNSVASRNC